MTNERFEFLNKATYGTDNGPVCLGGRDGTCESTIYLYLVEACPGTRFHVIGQCVGCHHPTTYYIDVVKGDPTIADVKRGHIENACRDGYRR